MFRSINLPILKYQKLILISLLFSTNFYNLIGQTQPIFQKIDQSQGLSSSRITGIVKEKNGFIWISTQNGLNRYDGHSVKVYHKQNSNIESNDISSLFLDSKNRIWLTSYGSGLSLYNEINDNFISFKNSINDKNSIISNRISTIIEDPNGLFWIGTQKGLCLFDYNQNKFYNYPYSITNQLNILSIYQDRKRNLLLGTFANGLLLFNTNTREFTKINEQKNQITNPINVIKELNSDTILVGTSGSGLLLFDLKTHNLTNYFNTNSILNDKVKIVRSIKKDSKDNLWVGTDGYGLFELQYPNSKEPIVNNYIYNSQLSSSLAGNAIYEISEDDDGNIWIGTAWNGISVLNKKNQTEIMLSDFYGLNVSPVLSIFQNDENIYLGLDGNGLNIYNKKNKKIDFYNKDRIGAKYVQKIIQTKGNKIWLGTFSNGLLKFDEESKKVIKYKNIFNDDSSLSFDDVRDIVEDEKKNLWIATWGGGLNYFNINKNTFSRYNFLNNNLISILKDKNKIWAASFGGGLGLFDIDKKDFISFNSKDNDSTTISSNNLFSLLKDSKGNLWIGTSGAGVNRMNLVTKEVERFQNLESIKYKTITSIIEDDENNIWFGSKKGIIKYDYSKKTFSTFSNLNGDFHINSAFKDKNGFLYFGGIGGVLKFDPRTINDTNLQPKVNILSFKIFNKEVPIGEKEVLHKNITLTKEITLEHFHNVITFEFSALKFPISTNCEYAIQMENFDNDWRKIGKDRTATFTNLAPGNYIFKVKSKEIGGKWGTEFTSLKIHIKKPYWLTFWAFSIYFILFLILLHLIRKNIIAWGKLKSNLELEKLTHKKDTELYNSKQLFFTNISHEIRTPVTLILSSINRLFDSETNKDSKQIKASQTIRRNSNLLLRLVNELLDVRKLETNDIILDVSKGEFVSFAKEIYLSFSDIALDRNIEYNFLTDENIIYLWFDNNQLEKVIFNLVSNAFKFTNDNGKIELKIEANSNEVFFSVNDTGIGLSLADKEKIFNRFYQVKYTHTQHNKGFGLGLSIVKDILKLHKGEITVSSKFKKGSSFEVKLLKGFEHFKDNLELNSENSEEENTIQKLQKKITDRKSPKETILIIEDHVEIQESLKELLENENYSIIQAFNGIEGLKLASTSLPNLIISDVMMPKMNGIELSKKIKTNTTTSHIPIIILTAKTSDIDKMEGYKTGADEYIIKPYNEEFLKNRIKNLLKNRKLLKQKFINTNLLNPKELAVNSKDQMFLENLYKSLEENLQSNNLKAQIICKNLNMSHSSMYKKIKALTGLTYMEFIRDYRLSIAKQLVEEMGYSVSEACYKVGYSDRKYFSKLFKNKFKKNPSFYLKS
jgi:signal transduction histidine kinase/ligand-binding sensor domain-containing protein/DNA-binding response OmpR family regulator